MKSEEYIRVNDEFLFDIRRFKKNIINDYFEHIKDEYRIIEPCYSIIIIQKREMTFLGKP